VFLFLEQTGGASDGPKTTLYLGGAQIKVVHKIFTEFLAAIRLAGFN
jgi:hypothetical protein